MADEHYLETAAGAFLAGMGSLWRWVRGRERKIQERMRQAEEHIVTNDRRLAVLETQRQSDQERIKRIDDTIANIDKKQDEQMKILVELAGRQGRR